MAKKRQVRTQGTKVKPPTLGGTLSYAVTAARGFQMFLDECRRIGTAGLGALPASQALPTLGQIVEADPEVGRLAVIYLETTQAAR